MRLVFAGTPAVAVPSLKALAASAHEVDLVVTRTDAPLGRRSVLTPSPVAAAAESSASRRFAPHASMTPRPPRSARAAPISA